jgi:transcriptional regulator GlxA family with amidase domain
MMINCPCCKGTGKIDVVVKPVAIERQSRVKMAKALRRKGLTIRQIAEVMGFKHPGSVSDLLKARR